jgi:hypothetical protein
MKIAIAFYGITRSLKYTATSIAQNVTQPAKSVGAVTVYCHFFRQRHISNPRTGEVGLLDLDEWNLLSPDVALLEEPDLLCEQEHFDALWPFGDAWEDEGQSLRNILRQLISLQRVTQEIRRNGGADVVIFLRPDMLFHDAFPMAQWKAIRPNTLIVPNWQWSGGLNDRFAICGSDAFETYGLRLNAALEFCSAKKRPMHSERLLMRALSLSTVQLQTTALRATRVRYDGTLAKESFNRVKLAKRVEAYLLCNIGTGLRSSWKTFSC